MKISRTSRRVLVLVAVGTLLVPGCESPAVEGMKVGNICPEIAGADAEGKTIRLSDFRGKVVFVSFWAPWCPPCRDMIPHERELLETKYKDRPFAILGVAMEPAESIQDFMTTTPMPWPNIVDGRKGPIVQNWNIDAIPAGIVVDHQGIIRGMWLDGLSPLALDRVIDAAVKDAEK